MIKPTIGRVVWFQPSKPADRPFLEQPFAAIVTFVWSDNMVNLAAFDSNGIPMSATSVKLLQDDDARPEHGHFAEWMPYQVGQAKKHEASSDQAETSVARAVNRITDALQNDPAYAWSWHCNIAMAAVDAGATREIGNEAAARFLQLFAKIDTRTFPEFAAVRGAQ